jgi:choline-sulfatase
MGTTANKAIDIPYDAPSIIRELKSEGYQTNLVGKTHWTRHDINCDLRSKEDIINNLGFDYVVEIAGPRALQRVKCELTDDWERAKVMDKYKEDLSNRYKYGLNRNAWTVRPSILPISLYPDCWITTKATERIKQLPEDKPWIIWVSYVGPHEPFDTPLPWSGQHKNIDLGNPIQCPEWIKRLDAKCELKKVKERWDGLLQPLDIDVCRRDYADHLKLLDDQVGILIREVENRVDFQRTAIAISSDHGEMLGDMGMLYKGTFMEGAIKVPWIYKEPSIKNGKRQDDYNKPVELTEIVKTTVKNLSSGGSVKQIQKECRHQKGRAIVEFKEERVFIDKYLKICVDKEGRFLWGVDLTTDPYEQRNILESKDINLLRMLRLKIIMAWAKKITKIRSNRRWIWRQL